MLHTDEWCAACSIIAIYARDYIHFARRFKVTSQ